jgi:hypothetical protein
MATEFIITDYTWQRVPDDFSLIEPESWKTPTKKRFGAVRKIYLIVKRRSVGTLNGPVLLPRTLPEGTEIKYEKKVSIVTKRIDTISTSVQKTITSKLSSELSTKLNAELGLFPVPVSAKVSGEVQSKIAAEFTTALTTQVSGTQSFEVTNLAEFTSSISLKAPSKQSPPLKYYFFLPVYTCYWDIYLYQQETLEFTYRSKLWFFKERQDEKYASQDLKVPLARIVFYEPVDDFPSLELDPFKPDVVDGSKVMVEKLNDPCPSVNYHEENSLQDLAAAAFPVTSEEEDIRRAVRAELPKKPTRKDKIVGNLKRSTGGARPSKGAYRGAAKGGAKGGAKRTGASRGASKSRGSYAGHVRSAGSSRKGASGRSGSGTKGGSKARG